MADEYLESANGDPAELRVYPARDPNRLWLEQDDDMIELDDQQASLLIAALVRFLNRA